MVGQGRNSADVAKRYMWEEKVELWWRMQGHKERTELCRQVCWIKNNPEKSWENEAVCSSNTLANF
jgi:hypothetical protein